MCAGNFSVGEKKQEGQRNEKRCGWKQQRQSHLMTPPLLENRQTSYCAGGFFFAGAFFFPFAAGLALLVPLGLMRLSASAALNGN